jgi:hypothetical protein
MQAPLPFVRQIASPMLFNRIRTSRQPGITPVMQRGQTSQGGTTQPEFSSPQVANVHLWSLKFSAAKNAHSLVVERIPAPERIAYAQDREPIIEINMSHHM